MILRLIRLIPLILGGACVASAHEHPGPAAGVVSIDVVRDAATVHLLVGRHPAAGKPAILEHLKSNDEGLSWSTPVPVSAGNPAPAGLQRGNDAQIAAFGQSLLTVWQTAGTDAWGGGPMATALSRDGGATWEKGPNPADDGSTEGHNFIDAATDRKGVFHLAWLDSRGGRRGLRSAVSQDRGQSWQPNRTVDPETCECCWNTLVPLPEGGVALLYRGRTPRDMRVARLDPDGNLIQGPGVVGEFHWDFPGCPHVGGGLCLDPSRNWHAVVWSGQERNRGLHHLSSRDAGGHWADAVRIGDETATHPDCACSDDGRIAIVWDTVVDDRSVIVATWGDGGGSAWRKPVVLSAPDRRASHPRVVAGKRRFRVFWTESRSDPPAEARWNSAALIPE